MWMSLQMIPTPTIGSKCCTFPLSISSTTPNAFLKLIQLDFCPNLWYDIVLNKSKAFPDAECSKHALTFSDDCLSLCLLTPHFLLFPWVPMLLSFFPKLSIAPSQFLSQTPLPSFSHCWLLSFVLTLPIFMTAMISSMSKASIRISPKSLSLI